MESMPVISDFVQAGAVGVCLALIVALGYIVRLFVGALMTFADVVRGFSLSVEKLNERIDRLEYQHHTDRAESRRKADKAA
jgi:hypothetical protein